MPRGLAFHVRSSPHSDSARPLMRLARLGGTIERTPWQSSILSTDHRRGPRRRSGRAPPSGSRTRKPSCDSQRSGRMRSRTPRGLLTCASSALRHASRCLRRRARWSLRPGLLRARASGRRGLADRAGRSRPRCSGPVADGRALRPGRRSQSGFNRRCGRRFGGRRTSTPHRPSACRRSDSRESRAASCRGRTLPRSALTHRCLRRPKPASRRRS
jgi:hypothetical protein